MAFHLFIYLFILYYFKVAYLSYHLVQLSSFRCNNYGLQINIGADFNFSLSPNQDCRDEFRIIYIQNTEFKLHENVI